MTALTPLRLPAGPVVYVDSIEAAALLARLTNRRLVWHTHPGAGRQTLPTQPTSGHEPVGPSGLSDQHRPAPASTTEEASL